MHDAQENEDVGDHDGRKQFKKILHPQMNHPEAPKIKVFETLCPKPGPSTLNPTTNPRIFARQTSENDNCQGTQKPEGKPVLATWLSAGDHGSKENARSKERSGDPENRKLKMPRARNVKGQESGEIKTEKVRNFSAVVLRRASQKRLQSKENRHHKKEPSARTLRGSQDHLVSRTERNALVLSAVPPQQVPTAKHREEYTDATKQSYEGKYAPNNCVRCRMIPNQRFRRPIVGVRIGKIWAQSRIRPSRPAEESRQLSNLLGVGDIRRSQAKPCIRRSKEASV